MNKSVRILIALFFAAACLSTHSLCLAADTRNGTPGQETARLIIKLKNDKTLEDIQELKTYYVVSSEKVFSDAVQPEEKLKELRGELNRLENGHERWYWQMEKDSPEYKDYVKSIELKKQGLREQIRSFEELINRLEHRQQRAASGDSLPDLTRTYLVKVESTKEPGAIASDIAGNAAVAYAEPDQRVSAEMVPNDPYYSSSGSWGQAYVDLWGLKKIQCETAWNYTQGEGVIVAVIDTGIDYNNSDLNSNVWTNTREIAGNAKDDDGNGFVDDTRGWDFVNSDKNPIDDNGHGTHLGGVIGAIGNNSKGIIGIAPKVKIMAVKGLDNQRGGMISDLVKAIQYAADNGADVINMSWNLKGDSQPLADAIQYAYLKGCVMVAAAGNYSESASLYCPAKLTQAITVASTDHSDVKPDFSNFGSKVDVSAPGGDSSNTTTQKNYVNILSLKASAVATGNMYVVNSGYYRMRGTSVSAPYVSGLAALLLSEYPDWSNELVRRQLRNTADSIDSLNPSYQGWLGAGRINANQAVTKVYSISGYVRNSAGTGISGMTVRFSNMASVTTNSSGYYKKTGVPNGTCTITLYKSGTTYTPYTTTINNANKTINFTIR